MPILLPPAVYCVKLFRVNVNAADPSLVQLSFLTAPGHREFAGQQLTATVSLAQPTSTSIQKLKSAFRIEADDIEELPDAVIAAKGRWGYVAVDWVVDGWEPRPVVRFITQTAQMRFQVQQIERADYYGLLL